MRSMGARPPARRPAAAALAGRAPGCVAATAAAAPGLPHLDAQTSLLVVAPHPDDETLCCAGVIQRVVRAGGRASVVWITSGDASELDLLLIGKSLFVKPDKARELAATRMREAREASARLGVPEAGQLFLGYPDRGVLTLLTDHRAMPYTSSSTGAAAVPYPAALFPGHPYTGESLERDFEAVLERIQPTLILTPSPRDSHPDHRAAGLLTIAVSTRRGVLPGVRYWILHGGAGSARPPGALSPGRRGPGGGADRAGRAKTPSNRGRRRIGKARVGDLLVGLRVPAEAPAIEVAGADRYPVVAQDHFRVQHARLVLEYLHAVAQHPAVEAPCRLAHPRMVSARARHQQPHVHAAARRPAQRLAKASRGYEIRAHDPGAPRGTVDAAQHAIGEHRALPGLAQRQAAGGAAGTRLARRRLRQPQLRSAAAPGAREGALPVADHRTLDLDHQLAPRSARGAGCEVVRESGAAHERHAAVAEQQLAMVAQQVREPVFQAQRVEQARSEERRVGKECRSRWSPYH